MNINSTTPVPYSSTPLYNTIMVNPKNFIKVCTPRAMSSPFQSCIHNSGHEYTPSILYIHPGPRIYPINPLYTPRAKNIPHQSCIHTPGHQSSPNQSCIHAQSNENSHHHLYTLSDPCILLKPILNIVQITQTTLKHLKGNHSPLFSAG